MIYFFKGIDVVSLACFVVLSSHFWICITLIHISKGRVYSNLLLFWNIVDLTSKTPVTNQTVKTKIWFFNYKTLLLYFLIVSFGNDVCEMWEDSGNRLRLRIASLWAKGQFLFVLSWNKIKVVTTNTSVISQRFSTNALFGLNIVVLAVNCKSLNMLLSVVVWGVKYIHNVVFKYTAYSFELRAVYDYSKKLLYENTISSFFFVISRKRIL